MSNAIPCLKIIFPEFFNHVAEHEPDAFDSEFPYLAKLINRSRIIEQPQQTIIHEILNVFGWDNSAGRLPNITAITADLDNLPYSDGLYRADPVHLRADGVRLRLFAGDYFAPNDYEADDLIRELNKQFPEFEFCRGRDPSRWYIRFPEALDFAAKTPVQMYQQVIDDQLPTGSDAKRLHGLMNECQMLMHQSEVNENRELAGKPAINSVWVWGGGEKLGELPSLDVEIYGNDLLALALAKQNGTACYRLPSAASKLKEVANHCTKVLIFNKPTGYVYEENAQLEPLLMDSGQVPSSEMDLQQLDQYWCEFIFKSLKRGSLKRLEIIDNYRCLQISAFDVWKFWRRSSYFSDRLQVDIDPQKISPDVSPHDTIN